MAETKPDDYIFEDVPVQQERIVSRTAEARVRLTTKSAVQKYIENYLSVDGKYRHQLELTQPYMVSYYTNLSGRAQEDDPTVYNVQLARMWKGLKQKLPAILIADTGFESQSPGLGGLLPGYRVDGFDVVQQTATMGPVSLQILTAAMDETTAGDLADVLTFIFGPLTIFNHGWILTSGNPEDSWEIRLPQGGVKPESLERRNITEDPVDSFWTASLSLEVDFEGIVSNRIPKDSNVDQVETILRGAPQKGSLVVPPDGQSIEDSYLVEYSIAETIRFGAGYPIQVVGIPWYARFVSDDERIAVVDENNVVRPRRAGSFNLMLVDFRPGLGEHGKVLRKDKVKVVLNG